MTLTIDKGISDIMGALRDPLIVMPGGWGETVPGWMKDAVTLERLMGNMSALKGEPATGTDIEAAIYLYTASLEAPMSHDWAEIYMYLTTKAVKMWKKMDLPPDVARAEISEYQKGMLRHLKSWIYEKRSSHRLRSEHLHRKQLQADKITGMRKDPDQEQEEFDFGG